ncbi:Pycsar system effector family protein [Pelobium manganitolerans]|uniref:Pycsar system effector family protein n=1 Tax=Pelobium manganitolerans TaxID=1842495 RepID=UPI003FA3A5B6
MNKLFAEEEIEKYIFELFKEKLPEDLLYHNFAHTTQTVAAAKELSEALNLPSEDFENVIVAAWFHDTGYTKNYENHEEESVNILKAYFGNKLENSRFEKIKQLILSTRYGHLSEGLLEEILHDADYISIGKKNFSKRAELLRCEWEKINNKIYDSREWAELQLDFLIRKRFRTKPALELYGKRREKNIEQQRKLIEKLKTDQYKVQLKKDSTAAKLAKEGRGIETLFRSVYGYHMDLSSMADQKANIMISINTIVVSVIITLFGSGYTFADSQDFKHMRFVFPMLLLVVSSLVSVTFAILSARPNITSKEKYELSNKNSSILFFGNFSQIKLKEFVDQIRALKGEKNELYDSMSVDIYHLGGVLVKKYKLLTWSYNIFMAGLILCAVGFIGIIIYSY